MIKLLFNDFYVENHHKIYKIVSRYNFKMVEAIEATKESGTITIKKDALWRYSTFLLLLVVVIGAFFMFRGNDGTGNNNGGNANGNTVVDLDPFLQNTQLYPSLGPEDADNVVIEFSDFQCPYCTMASGVPAWTADYANQYADLIGSAKEMKELAAAGEIRFIYVPMSFLDDRSTEKESDWAVEAGYCAGDQGKFWEMHDAIWAASTGPSEHDGKYSVENLKKIAAKVSGLNTGDFNECLESHKYASAVQAAAAQASTAASGTPTFYVNGKKVSASKTALRAAIGN